MFENLHLKKKILLINNGAGPTIHQTALACPLVKIFLQIISAKSAQEIEKLCVSHHSTLENVVRKGINNNY